MNEQNCVLLHLSDIHFRTRRKNYDLDAFLRNELERDARQLLPYVHHVDGIIVTGDIAFSGRPEEYDIAQDWVQRLAQLLGSRPEMVWTVPGNHDINRKVIHGSPTLQMVHSDLRQVSLNQIDSKLDGYLRDAVMSPVFLKPLDAYNAFAGAYGCTSTVNAILWQDRLPLNDGSFLRLNGVNSALISDALDDDKANKLIVSSFQRAIHREDGVTDIVLCHHPPNWLREQDAVEQAFNALAAVQLYGHKHVQYVTTVGDSLRVSAGAVHPDRAESGWLPRYNFLCFTVRNDDSGRILTVKVWPRVWNEDAQSFQAHFTSSGEPFRSFDLPLPRWEPPADPVEVTAMRPPAPTPSTDDPAPTVTPAATGNTTTISEARRRLIFRFFRLPYQAMLEISLVLNTVEEADHELTGTELAQQVFRRLESAGRLGDLWDSVERHYEDGRPVPNPFA